MTETFESKPLAEKQCAVYLFCHLSSKIKKHKKALKRPLSSGWLLVLRAIATRAGQPASTHTHNTAAIPATTRLLDSY
jgi:hypothetical protein